MSKQYCIKVLNGGKTIKSRAIHVKLGICQNHLVLLGADFMRQKQHRILLYSKYFDGPQNISLLLCEYSLKVQQHSNLWLLKFLFLKLSCGKRSLFLK